MIHIDEYGRIVIPMEIRKRANLNSSTPLEIYFCEDHLEIRESVECCAICHKSADLIEMDEKHLCRKCVSKILAASKLLEP